MANIKIVLLLCIVLISACTSVRNTQIISPIIGTWEGRDHLDQQARFIFSSNGSADIVLEGESFQQRIADNGTMVFTVGQRNTILNINIFINTVRGEKIRVFNMLAVVIEGDKLKIKMNRDQSLPKPFLNNTDSVDEKSAMILERVL